MECREIREKGNEGGQDRKLRRRGEGREKTGKEKEVEEPEQNKEGKRKEEGRGRRQR